MAINFEFLMKILMYALAVEQDFGQRIYFIK